MHEFTSGRLITSAVSRETMLLAITKATAYAAEGQYDKVLALDGEVLQSSAFLIYEGITPLQRLACIARVLRAARLTGEIRYADLATQKGMAVFNSVEGTAHLNSNKEAQRESDTVVCAYLLELGLYRQKSSDYLRAFHAFSSLFRRSGDPTDLKRAAFCAICIRNGETDRRAALLSVARESAVLPPSSLADGVKAAYCGRRFNAAAVEGLLNVAEPYISKSELRTALREHNLLLLQKCFACVHWSSLRLHMDDAAITEMELYELIVSMVRAGHLCAAIHQDTGYIEFLPSDVIDAASDQVTDRKGFDAIAAAAAAVVEEHPELLCA